MALLKQNDQLIASVPHDNLAHWLASNNAKRKDFDITLTDQEKLKQVRAQIASKAGDSASLLGNANDGMNLVLDSLAKLSASLHTANSLAEVRDAAKPVKDLTADFAAKVKAGTVKLPYQAKGADKVIEDIGTRATAVADVLAGSG